VKRHFAAGTVKRRIIFMKKKMLAAMLAVLMLGASACSSGNRADVNGTVVSGSEETEKSSEAGNESDSKEESTEQSAESESSDASSDEGFSVGENQGDYYENSYFGIRYTPSNGLVLQGEDYIKQMNAAVSEMMDDDSLAKKAIDDGTVVTVAAAVNADGSMNSNIGIQNATLMTSLVSEEALIDASLDVTQQELQGMGMFDSVEVTKGTAQFLGEEHYCVDVTATVSGVSLYEKVAILTKGKYAMFITVAGFEEDAPQAMLNDVSAIK